MTFSEYIDFVVSRTEQMYTIVQNKGHGPVWLVFVIGIIFGAIIQYARADKFEKIAGFAMTKDTIIPKMLFFAIGLTSYCSIWRSRWGGASYHVKSIMLQGLIIGMAIMGKCSGYRADLYHRGANRCSCRRDLYRLCVYRKWSCSMKPIS